MLSLLEYKYLRLKKNYDDAWDPVSYELMYILQSTFGAQHGVVCRLQSMSSSTAVGGGGCSPKVEHLPARENRTVATKLS